LSGAADLYSVAVPLAILSALSLAAVGLSWFALVYAKSLVQTANQRTSELRNQMEYELRTARTNLDELAADIRDFAQQPPVTIAPGKPRPGLNLTTRTQVLRLHRRGESPEKIAKMLEIPQQEVQLLLKVHRIVLASLDLEERRPNPRSAARSAQEATQG
jgi:hypothetical protein